MTKIDNILEQWLVQNEARLKYIYSFIKAGVQVIDPLSTYIAEGVKIGKGTVIYPLTYIESGVVIGENCHIGPFARVRKGVILDDEVHVGNFVEIVRSKVGKGSKVKHLTYVGDSEIGSKANIGAGTIVANYDGKQKSKTVIGDNAFVGSGSILIAPVKVGKNAVTGAGSVVTKNHDVPDDGVVVGIPARIISKKKAK